MFKLSCVSKYYMSGELRQYALKEVDLEILPGEFVFLTGPSGSGKSTLLGILGLINMPSSGEFFFEDRSVPNLVDRELASIRRNKIGIIFQHFNLHPALSALENVMYPLYLLKDRQAKEKAMEALEEVGMKDYAERRPRQLSGGQMQRVSIARAFVKRPEIIIADEPSANLDSENSALVYDLIESLNRKKNITVVVATHDKEFLKADGRTVMIKDGNITSDGRDGRATA